MSAARAPNQASDDGGWHALIADFLAGLFLAPPSADAIASYRDGLGAMFFDALAQEPACAAGTRQMQSAVSNDASPVAVARTLAVAFAHLFDGVDGPRTVPLYESAYVSQSGRLFQESVGDMDALLRQLEVSTSDACVEPADHLSIELALLARLIRGDDIAGTFGHGEAALLDLHLLVWAPIFVERCCDADRTGFYAGAASVLNAFLAGRDAALQRGCLPAAVIRTIDLQANRTGNPRTGDPRTGNPSTSNPSTSNQGVA
jgi:TorA-specific chaperone